ncbi:hypothetical protein HELRODRAFT_194533 [Helobdella robusta]|uniref:Carboxylesterase type B domain-containing protein n=1 Tax=Helobdella robusta TaxID=6412 RepID=T1FW60_HELRO|nr:hypothetical protein HELRODRAFT_194533 [Helobdella robusta]ESN91219.1 hypothetical protein HELRODRAFT_194533 [Helobdella robusta]
MFVDALYFEQFPLHSSFGVEFRPIVDNDLMFEHPREAIIAGRYHKVPFYTGVVENEFTYFINDMSRADHIDNLHLNIELFLNHSFNCKSNKRHSIVKIVKYNYIDWVETEKTNKYVYYWFFRHPNSCHMFELNYLFGVPFGNEPVDEYRENKNWNESTIEDRMLSEKIIKLWVSIAGTSKPGPIDGLIWPEYNTSTQHYITISAEPTSINQHFQLKTNNFWNVYLPEMFQDICENSLYEGVSNRTSSFFDFSIANPQNTVEDNCKNGRSDGGCDGRSGNGRSALVLCYVALPCLVLLSIILAFVVLKFKRKNAKLIRTIKHFPTSRAV